MPISALSEGTVRRLGSALVITSPVLLLKELLDNAIDSGATSVDVIVSSNTVDKIEVRDNGHGIDPDDFDSLGRPGHTSKLRSFDELSEVGVTTLGFRGAALASANALAEVSLITRVSTEHVATAISLAKGGGINTQRHAAAPVGTAVCVTNLFSHLPVRLQGAVKEAPKSLVKMRDLLQCYALARPWIKLRFTVLKMPKMPWCYSPGARGDVKAAVMQLFGTELASQCIFEVFPRRTGPTETELSSIGIRPNSSSEQGAAGLVFEAFLPRPEADMQKIAEGAFFSVNSRPVSPARGTARKLLSTFKQRLGDHFARVQAGDTPKDPFIRLNIRCPPESYDVNIEPSKEDVIFKEERHLLEQFESFLSSVYSNPARNVSPQPLTTTVLTDVEVVRGTPRQDSGHRSALQALAPPLWRVDMSSSLGGVSDDGGDGDGAPTQQQKQQEALGDVSEAHKNELRESKSNRGQSSTEGLNPWSIAKLTSMGRRGGPLPDGLAHENSQESRLRAPESAATNGPVENALASPQVARSKGGLGFQRGCRGRLVNPVSQGSPLQDLCWFAPPEGAARSARPPNGHGRSRMNLGLQSSQIPSYRDCEVDDAARPNERLRQRDGRGPDRLLQSQISFNRGNRQQSYGGQDDLGIDRQLYELVGLGRRVSASASPRRLYIEEANHPMAVPVRVDLGRRREVSQNRQPLRYGAISAAATSPEALRQDGSDEDTLQPHLPTEDPRAQLIEQQHPTTHHSRKKLKRMKSAQLPLETIPRECRTCALVLTVMTDVCRLAQLLSRASEFDGWLADGELRGAFRDGAAPEDAATLFEALLSQTPRRAPVTT